MLVEEKWRKPSEIFQLLRAKLDNFAYKFKPNEQFLILTVAKFTKK